MTVRTMIDHLVLAVPDLDDGVRWFESLTGIAPEFGGAHIGRGTHNALVSLGDCYLEIIAPDPAQPPPEQSRPFGVDAISEPTLVTFAIRCAPDPNGDVGSIDTLIAAALAGGWDPGPPLSMSRETTEGDLLSWRLTMPPSDFGGAVPFIIDWGDAPNPCTTVIGGATLHELRVAHPRTEEIGEAYTALRLDISPTSSDHQILEATLAAGDRLLKIP